MLNPVKLMKELQRASGQLFLDRSEDIMHACQAWNELALDTTAQEAVTLLQMPRIPTWQGSLKTVVSLEQAVHSYTAYAVDGSQIYPDKHQGISCFLINIGTVLIKYAYAGKSCAFFDSCPYVIVEYEEVSGMSVVESVNLLREEFELQATAQFLKQLTNESVESQHSVCLIDGTIIFWFLESKEQLVKNTLLAHYLQYLNQLAQASIAYAGYISRPRSVELVQLIKLFNVQFDVKAYEKYEGFKSVVDVHLVQSFLPPFHRTLFFKNNSIITTQYPEHLQPYFCFVHVGSEIIRLELPAWLIADEEKCNYVCAVCIDQVRKGKGYPVVLAEAHEQAVIKGSDRELFYQAINSFLLKNGHYSSIISQKTLKKRQMNI